MKAVEYFNSGFSCSESIIKEAVEKGIVPEELLPVATSFCAGIGVGCLCGAVAASQIVIGWIYGRDNKFGNEVKAKALAKQFMEEFKKNHKATCCRALTNGLDMGSPERKAHCSNTVNDCSKILEEMIKVKV